MPEGLDDVPHPEPDRAEEEREEAGRAVLDEVREEGPRRSHQGKRRGHPGEVEDEDEWQIEERRNVAERYPEHEEVDGGARLGRVAVVPRPRAFPALAHLGQVCVGVVAEVEKAHEHLAVGLHRIRIEVGQRGNHCERESREHRDFPVAPRPLLAVPNPLRFYPCHAHLFLALPRYRARRRRTTVQSALLTSPRETFDAPATRSSNLIGVSTTRYPFRRAR